MNHPVCLRLVNDLQIKYAASEHIPVQIERLTSPPPSWSPAPCSWLKMSRALYSFHTWQPAQSLQGSRKTTSPALLSSRPTTRPARNTRSRSLPRLKGKYFLCHLIWMITHQIIINEDIRVWILLEPSCQWKTQIFKCSDFRFHPKSLFL